MAGTDMGGRPSGGECKQGGLREGRKRNRIGTSKEYR